MKELFYQDRSALMRAATLRIAARWALKIERAVWRRNAPRCGVRMGGPARIVLWCCAN